TRGRRGEHAPAQPDPQHGPPQRTVQPRPIPETHPAPPAIPDQARQLMASKGYGYTFSGAWMFVSDGNPHAWHSTPWNFLPRFGLSYKTSESSVVRFAYARYLLPTSNVRDTLGDFVEQYAGYAQTTNTLGLANGVPRQTLADPFPSAVNPVIEPYGQSYGRYTNLGGAANLDEYELRPQKNDRFNASYQKEVWRGTVVELS